MDDQYDELDYSSLDAYSQRLLRCIKHGFQELEPDFDEIDVLDDTDIPARIKSETIPDEPEEIEDDETE